MSSSSTATTRKPSGASSAMRPTASTSVPVPRACGRSTLRTGSISPSPSRTGMTTDSGGRSLMDAILARRPARVAVFQLARGQHGCEADRMCRRCLLVAALLSLALASGASAACTPGWRSSASPSPGSHNNFFGGVAAVSANDAWAVGAADDLDSGHTLAAHWNGTKWTVIPTPSPGSFGVLDGAAAVAPDDVWAVGYYFVGGNFTPLTIHWDGANWTEVPNPGASGQYLVAVDA